MAFATDYDKSLSVLNKEPIVNSCVGIIDVAFAADFNLKWLAVWIYSELKGL